MKSRIFFPLLFPVLLLAACGAKTSAPVVADDVIPVRVQVLATDSIREQFQVSGQFSTDDETLLSFKTGGVIQRILVNEGDAVKKGQLMATLHLTEINAATTQARLALEKAQRDFDRASNLYRDSVATLEQWQNARTALDIAKQQAASAGFNQQYSEIRAVTSGYVLRKFANEGQVVAPGTPVLQMNGAANADWVLKVGVSDLQWARVQEATRATVQLDAAPGEQYEARVKRKTEGIDPQTGTFQLQLQLLRPPVDKLASGLFGKATLYPQTSREAWPIPYDALLDGDAREAYVFVTNDDSTAQKIKVEVSRIDRDAVWISAGLQNAKKLIVSGSAYLNDGSRIRITNSVTSPDQQP